MDNCGDYKRLSIYPTQSEILGERGDLRKNISKGKFQSVHHYLDLHFKLLREDFIACLREGIQSYQSKESTKNVDIYENTRIFKEVNKRGEECLKIKIPPQDEDSKKFMNGSLLLFTRDDFATMFMAKVLRRNTENCEIFIDLIDMNNNRIKSSRDCFTMAESGTYFDPYFHVLCALQAMSVDSFPMEKYLVQVDTSSVYIPRYLLNSNQNYKIGNYSFPPHLLQKFGENCLRLNEAQFTAFKAALSQEFVVIQGPPGTGKTFLGLKIVETLVRNSHFWYRNSPILVVSQKNFALDQFLEGLIPITERLVRVGAQSKSEKLKEFNLYNEKTEIDNLSYSVSHLTVKKDTMNVKRDRQQPKDFLSTMKQALVVGMTTSLAARWRPYLDELKCPIVIVEEAAEVLEAHVVASLTNHCQHLILLGDHQQLQPITSDYSIGKNYKLGISLFERMINNGIQCYTLDVQHRMRPEISNLLKVKIYPFLQDHESVHGRPSILGVDSNVFFVDHRWSEETSNISSKKNSQEAEFLVAFARHLVLNGYKAEEIVVLAAYAGQIQELERCAQSSRNKRELEDVKIMTVDAFQGREADIVLLSLVRSDDIGFLSAQNRVCVALSRARNGFYIAGNMDLLSRKSVLWNQVKKCLQRQNSIGQELPLRCQIHPRTVTKVQCADDFLTIRDGGCARKCYNLLSCGHHCHLLCHTKYKQHECARQCQKKTIYSTNDRFMQEYRDYRDNSRWDYLERVGYWNDRRLVCNAPAEGEIGILTNIINRIVGVFRSFFNIFS